MTALVTGDRAAPLRERGDDLYETPDVATKALLRVEKLPQSIWEPACGLGAITRVLREAGHHVFASDLVDYKSRDQDKAGWDFLLESRMPDGTRAIVTNPPYKNADEFVRHALHLAPKVAMLLRLAFLESERRSKILEQRLARVWLFRKRLPMMHRDGWTGPKASSAMAFAWFVWEAEHSGPIRLERTSWQ